MKRSTFALALALGTLTAAPAFAQNTPAQPDAMQPAKPMAPAASDTSSSAAPTNGKAAFVTQASAGQYRASELVGVNIYNGNNESIGEVNELLVDKSGAIQAVVIGVGGFLGIGEKNVALPYTAVKWEDRAMQTGSVATGAPATSTTGTTAAPGTTTTGTATTGTGMGAGNTMAANTTDTTVRDYPDHGTVSLTKADLEAAPEFKYASEAGK